MFGYSSPEEAVATVKDICREIYGDPQQRAKIVQAVEAQGFVTGLECEFVRKDGSTFWGSSSITIARYPDGRAIRYEGMIQDVTKQKRAVDSLRQSQETLRMLGDSAPVGIFLTDAEGEPLFVNRYCREMSSLQEEEAGGGGWIRILHPDYRPRVLKAWHEAQVTGRGYAVETRYFLPDESLSHMLAQVAPVRDEQDGIAGFVETTIYIADLKRTEQALHESERNHRALVENLPDIVMRFDRECRYLYVNPSVQHYNTPKPEEYIGRSPGDFGLPEHVATRWVRSISSVFESRRSLESEIEWMGPTRKATFDCRLFPEFTADGEVETVLCLLRDITQLRDSEGIDRNLFEKMRSGFALCEILRNEQERPVDYRFLSVNPAFERLTGLASAGFSAGHSSKHGPR